jgi:aquaporin Z
VSAQPASRWRRLRDHLPEYLIEAFCLGVFMVAAGLVTTLLEYQGSRLHAALADGDARRVLAGLAMGLTAIALIYSPWGARSGAHMNPAVTLSFLRLGKIAGLDAVVYIGMQFAGGLLGVLLVRQLAGASFTAPPVNWVVTVPGRHGAAAAFAAEALISALLMWTVLSVSSSPRHARYTGVCAGALVALFISIEGPLSGMSMNPARSFASAAPASMWHALWIYFTAPFLGMLAAAEVFLRRARPRPCAKLRHSPRQRCIHCGYVPG